MFYMARIVGYATLTIGLVASIAFMHNQILLEGSFATIFIGFAVYGIGIYEPEIKKLDKLIRDWKFTKYIDRQFAVSYTTKI